jgi:hypothetical protein
MLLLVLDLPRLAFAIMAVGTALILVGFLIQKTLGALRRSA